MRLLNIVSHGASYPSRSGNRASGWFRSAGFNHAFVEGEARPRYYSEDKSWREISDDLKSKGIDTSEFDRNLDNWVKTGKGAAVI